MLNFDLKNSDIYLAIRWEKFPLFGLAKGLKKLSAASFIIVFILFVYGFAAADFSQSMNRRLLGLSLILFVCLVFFQVIDFFCESKLKKPSPKISLNDAVTNPEQHNLAELLSFEAARAVYRGLRKAGLENFQTGPILYELLTDAPKVNFIFNRLLLSREIIRAKIKKELKKEISEASSGQAIEVFQGVISDALKIVQKREGRIIEAGDMISALVKWDSALQKILLDAGARPEDVEHLSAWWQKSEEWIYNSRKFWSYENLAKNGTLAKEWTAGYTITLDRFSRDLTRNVRGNTPDFVVHGEQVKIVERILARREINNVLLIGEPGSGRKSIIYGLAQRSLLGRSLAEVNYKRVVQLDMPGLLAQIQDQESLEITLDRIFSEAVTAGNVILFIDEFNNYIGNSSKPGVIDISGVLIPYLRLPNFQIICLTNYEGFHRNVEKNPSALSLFEKIEVPEVTEEEALLVLETFVPVLEKKYKIFISYPALRDIISLTAKYLPAISFPEKAIKILDEVAVYVATAKKEKIVLPKHVAKIITERTEIPVGEMKEKEKQVLLNLENLIHQRIVNQDEAVKDVATAMRRARAEVTVRKGPIGTFLFLGPTGVGKTETSKALAEFYFGSEKRMIRLDMSEFQDVKDIPRLIASEGEIGLLVSPVRENPFSLLLLDEIEKAHPNILNLFLQILDEGHLTDGLGKKVDFKNTIIIATSNAGYQIILEAIKNKVDWGGVKQNILDYLFAERTFRPEFINRFDGVVVFKPLSQENLFAIAEMMLKFLKKNLKEKGIDFAVTEPLKRKIAELGYNPIFGAREMKRVIQDKVENVLASAIISSQIGRGSSVEINPDTFEIIVNPAKK